MGDIQRIVFGGMIPRGRERSIPEKRSIPESEWKTDENGKQYRYFGPGCREYRGEIMTTRGTILEGQENEQPQRENERSRAIFGAGETEKPKELETICPFKRFKGAMINNCSCRTDCAFYDPDSGGCRLARGTAETDTKGKDCFLFGICSNHCALYKGGCTLAERKESED